MTELIKGRGPTATRRCVQGGSRVSRTRGGLRGALLGLSVLLGASAVPASAWATADLTASMATQFVPYGTASWQARVKINVMNLGDTPAYDVWVVLFDSVVGAPNPATDTPVAETFVDVVPAYDSIAIELTFGPVSPGPLPLVLVVDPLGLIPESNKANNTVSATPVVPAAPKLYVDLVPLDLQIDQVGQEVIYTVWVGNLGTATSPAFTVDLFIGPSAPSLPDFGYPHALTDPLPAGEARPVFLPSVWLPDGGHDVWVAVDAMDWVPELNEANNVAGPDTLEVQWASPPALPDLFVSRVDAVPTEAGHILYAIDVHNGGGASAPAGARVHLHHDPSDPPAVTSTGNQAHDILLPIPSGGTHSLVMQWPNAPQTYTEAWITLQAPAGAQEASLDNNILGPVRADPSGGPERPDLVVERVEPQVDGFAVRFEVEVRNVGTAPAEAFDVFLYPTQAEAPDPVVGTANEQVKRSGSGLPAGGSRVFEFEWAAPSAGAFTALAWVDPLNGVLEGDTTNNVSAPAEYTVQAPATSDLYLTGFKATQVGNDLRFSATLHHVGTAVIPPSQAALFVDSTSPPVAGQEPTVLFDVPALAPGETRALVHVWTDPPDGTYRSWLVADWWGDVNETDESNNTAGPLVTVVGETLVDPCPLDALIDASAAPCLCVGVEIATGYCCEAGPQVVPCSASTPEPGDGGGELPTPPGGGPQGGFTPVPSSPGGEGGGEGGAGSDSGGAGNGGGGCRQSGDGGPLGGLLGLLLLSALLRRSRD